MLKVNGTEYDWKVVREKPWLIEIWEPLTAKVPNPNLALAFCCYSITVIFYVRPYQTREFHHFYKWSDGWHSEEPGKSFQEWGRVDSKIDWHSYIEFDGTRFEMTSGRVEWREKRWWMKFSARRVQNLDL